MPTGMPPARVEGTVVPREMPQASRAEGTIVPRASQTEKMHASAKVKHVNEFGNFNPLGRASRYGLGTQKGGEIEEDASTDDEDDQGSSTASSESSRARHRRLNKPVLFYQQYAMRLNHPDDTGSGHIFLDMPTMVCHRVDRWSPLVPPTFVDEWQ